MEIPPAGELAEMIREGCKVGALAREHKVKVVMLLGHLYRGGYGSDGHPIQKHAPEAMNPTGLNRLVRSWLEPWMVDAACRYEDPALFFPEKGGDGRNTSKYAKAICAECFVADDCRAYALLNKERFGIWAGTNERERRKILKESAA